MQKFSCKSIEAAQAKESRGGGEEEPDFSRSGNVALCLFTSKAMAALRWFLPRESSCIINRKIKLKPFAAQTKSPVFPVRFPARRRKIKLLTFI